LAAINPGTPHLPVFRTRFMPGLLGMLAVSAALG
jgi:hypothetical protein